MTQEQIDNAVPVCSACHDAAGRSVSPYVPRLAGQSKEYLIAQLKAFRDKTRVDPPNAGVDMAGMATHLDDAMIARLASYYAAQHPVAGSARHSAGIAAGRNIYEQGISSQILPCMACHGSRAQGAGAGATPLLAGQDRAYLDQRLGYFATDKHADTVMHLEAMYLTSAQRATVPAYQAAQSEGTSGGVAPQGAVTQEEVARTVRVCSSCHEFGGPDVPSVFVFPRLAGQQKAYLIAQLKAFRNKTRADPRARAFMWDRAAHLSDPMIERLAAFYAAQAPLSGSAQNPADVAAGERLYEQGVPDKVLPCMACHGAEGEGTGIAPRLAGQHRLSLERQLTYFATNKRTGGLMPQESVNLTERQITEVSAYLAARSEGKPSTAARTGPVTQERVEATARVCSSCHEFGGRDVPSVFVFPRLAGQQKAYLIAQLKALRDKTRADPRARAFMWDRAAHLSDPMIVALAGYYSAKPPVAGKPGASPEIAAGAKIFAEGIPSQNAPACSGCHGAKGKGNGPIPRLAGQHRVVLERQLAYFASKTRASGIMHQQTNGLTPEQMRAVSAFLATQ